LQIATLLGAGFSKWSCNLPLVNELFDFNVHSDNDAEEQRVTRLKTTYQLWRKSHRNEHNEAFIRFAQYPSGQFNLVNWYITRRLTEPFIVVSGRRRTWYINSYRPKHHKGIDRARRMIELLNTVKNVEQLGLITTNYDMVAEYALGPRAFNYGIPDEQIGFTPYPYTHPLYLTGSLKILKLHGSISWSEEAKFPDLRCGLTGKCLIVPPVTEKKVPKLLKPQWTLARKILAKCEVLVVFGFSFNEFDVALRTFIAKNLSGDAKIIFIDLIDPTDRLSSLLGGHKMVYLDASKRNLASRIRTALKT
jgi:hypothetical protein